MRDCPRAAVAVATPQADTLLPTSLWSSHWRPLTIGMLAVMTLVAFEGFATSTAMPLVAVDLQALDGYTWAFNAYVLASIVGMVGTGVWSDVTGPRGPLGVAVAVFAVGAVVCGLAPNLAVLVLGRGLQGLGGGGILVAVYVIIARAYPEALRPRALLVLAAGWVLPSLIGPVVAGSLAETVGWRWVFLVVPVLVLPPTLLLLPRTRDLHRSGSVRDVRGRLTAAVIAAGGLLALQSGSARLGPVGITGMVIGVALIVVAARTLLPPGSLRLQRGLPTSVMMRGIVAAAFFSAEVFVPLALVELRGASVTVAGLVLAVSGASWMLGSYTQSRLPGSQDRARLVRIGCAIVAIGIATVPLVVLLPVPVWTAAASWWVASYGMGMVVPAVAVQTMRLSPDADQGRNSSALQLVDAVLVVVATAWLGIIHASAVRGSGTTPLTYSLIWWLAALVALLGVFAAPRMRPAGDSAQ